MDFSNSYERPLGSIYDYIDDEEIYLRLLGFIPNTKTKYKSPFSQDRTPSFCFVQKDRLLWKCFSSDFGGDAISLVAKMSGGSLNYEQAVYHVYNNYPLTKNPNLVVHIKKETKIEVILHDKIPSSFYDYWNSFHVTNATLDFFNIKPAKEVWINDKLGCVYTDKNPIIRYLIDPRYKIYQPFNEKYKWVSNTKNSDIQGFKELPATGDLLILSKSFKDIGVLKELSYNAISACSENTILGPEIIDHLKGRFKTIISFLDNDEPGIKAMNRYYDKYKIPFTHIPVNLEHKDIAEFAHSYGLKETQNLLTHLKL